MQSKVTSRNKKKILYKKLAHGIDACKKKFQLSLQIALYWKICRAIKAEFCLKKFPNTIRP
jgi:hypothetical protein